MSGTAVLDAPLSISEMVIKIRADRAEMKNKRLKALAEDEKLTELIVHDTPGLRKGKHRASPIEAALYIPEVPAPKHLDTSFVRPTSLFELMNMEGN